jgi:Zn-dependent M28 family amino/carboxypeptidase
MAFRLRFAALALVFCSFPITAADTPNTSVARMRSDLTFLASAECEGRGPGTAGIDKAADYIAESFRKAGLKGAMPDGSYFQPFTIRVGARLGKDLDVTLTGANFGTMALKLNSSFNPMAASSSGSADGPIVFAGYGITAESLKYDDYADLDVEGKIVLVIRKSPGYGAEKRLLIDSQLRQQVENAMSPLAAFEEKVKNAAKHKAAALIMVNDAGEADDKIPEFRGGGTDLIPAVQIKRSVADEMLRSGMGKSIDEVERSIAAELKPVSQLLKGWTAHVAVQIVRTPAKNVVAVLEGAGPLADQTLVIGAHYDHLGYGGSGSLARGAKAIHFGADDNGSGTTAVIELARRLATDPPANRRRLVCMTFSGEELGLLGSQHYADHPIFPLKDTVAMINLDMVGRLAPDAETQKGKLDIGGTGTAKSFDGMIEKLNAKYDFKLRKSAAGIGPSDHTSFFVKGVPVFFFFTGLHKEYHRPTDVVDLINFEGMNKITDMVEELARSIWTDDARPEFVKVGGSFAVGGIRDSGSSSGRGPSIRFMPGNYDDEAGGALVATVTKDGPADKAGIKDGDLIVEVAGVPVKNMTAYTAEMRKQKAGQPLEFTIVRKNERIKVTVTPE